MSFFSHFETCRRFSHGNPPVVFVKAAFAIALDDDVPQEELDELGRWREQVRNRPDGDAPGALPARDAPGVWAVPSGRAAM